MNTTGIVARHGQNCAKKRGWLEGGEQGKLSYRPGPRLREFRAGERKGRQ